MKEAWSNKKISFGDTVRVVSNELTRNLGLAGLLGMVSGQTIPTISGVTDIIGSSSEDYAVNVFFDDRDEGFWFAENLLEFTDHGAGIEFTINVNESNWTRSASGDWYEE